LDLTEQVKNNLLLIELVTRINVIFTTAFNEHDNTAPPSQVPPHSPSNRAYPSTDEIKHLAAAAAAAAASGKQPRPSPQSPFSEHPFVPRTMHHSLYR
jgi:hypothetical protein